MLQYFWPHTVHVMSFIYKVNSDWARNSNSTCIVHVQVTFPSSCLNCICGVTVSMLALSAIDR